MPYSRASIAAFCHASLVAAVLFAAGPVAIAGDDLPEPPVDIGPTRISVPVRSFVERRDAGIIKQRYDYSCGAASFATLLTYGLDDPIEEEEVIARVVARLTETESDRLKSSGLSLLDLQKLAIERGHKAEGFRLHIDQLSRIERPVIVFIKPFGYAHFAVLRGIRGDRVHLADPSLGHWRLPLWKFREMWADAQGKGVIFVAERKDGRWLANGSLALAPGPGGVRPELLSVRQLLDVTRRPEIHPALGPQIP
jgi:predicted double-glycine peptidase